MDSDLKYQYNLKSLIDSYYKKRAKITTEVELRRLNESYKKSKKRLKELTLKNEGVKDLAKDVFIDPVKEFPGKATKWSKTKWGKAGIGIAAAGATTYAARKAYLAAKRRKAMQGIPKE